MKLIRNIYCALNLGVRLLQHHLFHGAQNFQRGWGDGEVFMRCQRCGLRSHGVQPGPMRLATRLPGDPTRLRLDIAA